VPGREGGRGAEDEEVQVASQEAAPVLGDTHRVVPARQKWVGCNTLDGDASTPRSGASWTAVFSA
jgi:hypothetical protein